MESTQEIIKVARGRPRKPRPIQEEDIVKRKDLEEDQENQHLIQIYQNHLEKQKRYPFGGTINHYTSSCITRIDQEKKLYVSIVVTNLTLSLH
jgi:hypothetical protein